MVDEKADAIISDDSDFSMYVGTYGIDLMVKYISIKMTGDPISSCRLCTGQESVATMIEAFLNPKLGYSPFTKTTSKTDGMDGNVPTYPIFSGLEDPMTRALLGMIAGCDVCPKGVEKSGPAAASRLLREHVDESGTALHVALAEAIFNMNGCTVKDMDAIMRLAQSILYEKTNDN